MQADFNIYAKVTFSGLAQDIMFSMRTMGLCQIVSAPISAAGHTLDLGFYSVDVGDLGVEEFSVVSL